MLTCVGYSAPVPSPAPVCLGGYHAALVFSGAGDLDAVGALPIDVCSNCHPARTGVAQAAEPPELDDLYSSRAED